LDYEATSQTLDVTVRVVVVDSSGATTVRVGGAEKDLSIPMANVNEAPVDLSFVQSGTLQEATAAGVVVGTLSATDPDCGTPCLTPQTFSFVYVSGSPEFTVDGDEIKTTAFPTNFEPPGPAYTFTVRVIDQGGLPTPSTGSLTKTFTVVVTDKIESPSAEDATFAINENVAAGTFVGNYGSKVTLGDAELTFDIVRPQGNSARQEYTYTALTVNAADGKATMTLNSASSTGEVIKTGDKLQVWDSTTKQDLVANDNGKKVWVQDDEITFKVGTTATMATAWAADDIIFVDTTGCTNTDTGGSMTNDEIRMKVNGPKKFCPLPVIR
jgi:hypothetical protein